MRQLGFPSQFMFENENVVTLVIFFDDFSDVALVLASGQPYLRHVDTALIGGN